MRLVHLLPLLLLACTAGAPQKDAKALGDDLHAIDTIIQDLYSSVSFGPGGGPNWEEFGALVRPDAIFVATERGPTPTKYMSMQGFRQDWVDFMAEVPAVVERGFHENVVRHQTAVFGNVAHSFVVFKPRIGPGDDRPVILGVDSIQLIRDQGRWWVASITTQFETKELKVPDRF